MEMDALSRSCRVSRPPNEEIKRRTKVKTAIAKEVERKQLICSYEMDAPESRKRGRPGKNGKMA